MNNTTVMFLKQFIRIRSTISWTSISFGGFILGLTSLDLYSYIIPFLLFVISTFFIMSFTFAINNYYDADSDRENPIKINYNAIASGKISKKVAMTINIFLVITPLIITFVYKFQIFLFCIFFIFWMWIYSSPPLRLKGRSGVDIIWHFFAFLIIVLWGSYFAGSVELINWLAAISLGVFSCIAQIENHINDYAADKKTGTKTFAVWIGIDKAKTSLKIVALIHTIILIILFLLYSVNYLITIFLVVLILLFGIYIIADKVKKQNIPSNGLLIYYSFVIISTAIYSSLLVYHLLTIGGNFFPLV